jgi:2-polyprenyl-3-methyl-5-hydroxy-6-metoxy-1,4-benzoquinol methylase
MNSKSAFSESAEQYFNYTRMPWGRLFYQMAWHQIDQFLTDDRQSILDIGCGFGISSNEYSRRGHTVTGVEPTQDMLEIAAKEGQDVRYINDAFEQAAGELGMFDWIFCHNILEYNEDPVTILKLLGGCQQSEGYVSLIAHNPAAKVMKRAILGKDPDRALASFGSSKDYSSVIGTDINIYTYEQLTEWLNQAGYQIAGHCGIHNIYGYITDNEIKQSEEWHNKAAAMEMELGNHSPYRDIAQFTHIVAKKVPDRVEV